MLPTITEILRAPEPVLVWGLVATVALTVVLYGSQGMGLSRLSLPFILGTCLSARRSRAVALGLIMYTMGGWVFAFLYAWLFAMTGMAGWWFGAAVGALHGLFLLAAVLPVVPYLHPRMASPHSGPSAKRRLEPPGFLGLNYGYRTPLTTMIAHLIYGAILGASLGA